MLKLSLCATASLIAACVSLPTGSHAQELSATISPDARPYPYAILDMQPGALPEDAVAHYEERMGIELSPLNMELRVQAPTGRAFSVTFPQRYETAGVGPFTRMGTEPYSEVLLDLGTQVMDGRVVSIARTVREADLPDPAALQAQLEGLYGPPSRAVTEGLSHHITYAWGADGFIPDLDAVEEVVADFDINGETRSIRYRPCHSTPPDRHYRFAETRQPVAPGCTALFRISIGGQRPSLTFALIDYDLLRQSTEETDAQIKALLTGDAEPSNFDL